MDLTDLHALFSPPSDPSLLAAGSYDPWLVLLSIAVAIFSSGMAFQLTARASGQRSHVLRSIVLISGSLSLGAGVWAMHFIGMLALRVCAVSYDPAITFWSMLPSVAASALALWLISRTDLRWSQLVCGGIAVGAGIGAMHYTGMAAMRMAALLRYDLTTFALSLAVAVVLAMLALWVRFGLRRSTLNWSDGQRSGLSAVIMGLAIAGTHYTGMAAARFVGPVAPGTTTNATFIALAISAITVAFTMLVLIANGALRNRDTLRRLLEREVQWRSLLSTAPDGVLTFSGSGRIGECNASAEQIFARRRAEIIGQDIHSLIAGQQGLSTGEAVALRPDGTIVPIRLGVGARRPELDLQVCFVTDISAARAMAHALRDSEHQLRSLISNIPGISYRFLIEDGWPTVFISDAVERLTGYPVSDFIGPDARLRYIDLVHPDDRAALTARVVAAIRESKPYLLEYRITHRDGRERFMWGSGSPVLDADGRHRYLVGVILDITERRQMEQELRAAKERAEQAAAARAAFLANMSHEIRTPMNSIIGFTDVLMQGTVTPQQRRHLLTVSGAARSLLRLLNEILDTAKLDKGLVELELRNFDLLELIDEVSSTLGASAREKGLDLHMQYQSGLPRRYRGDSLRVRQVLTNLISNAVKFTVHGSITLDVSGLDQQVHFTVRDTGIGIAADRLQAIFDPFIQADPSMSRRYGGTGLGTTISKQLVELMGGRIWVESTPGVGSCFHVQLPLLVTEGSLDQTSRHRQLAQLPPLRILAADDAPQNLELLTLLLGAHGHTIVPAYNGLMAVQLAAEQHFDLVLMDVQMPDMDGLAATRKIRAQEIERGGPRVPIIALSASVLAGDRQAALDSGMDAFASKPVDLVELSYEIGVQLGLLAPNAGAHKRVSPGAQLLNAEQGLARWDHKLEPYLRALRHFSAEYAKLPTLLSSYGAFGGALEARSLAHRVKGAAANLGLESLAGLLDEFERKVTSEATEALPPLLARLRHLLYDSCAAIEIELAKSPAASGVARPLQDFDSASVRALIHSIGAGFKSGELNSAAFAQLLVALGGYVEEARLDELQRIVDDFDFVLANERMHELCTELELPAAVQA